MAQAYVFINDRLIPATEAQVTVEDRGFLYGDGFFETIRVEAGRILFLAEHLARLYTSAAQFRIELPSDFPWADHILALLAQNGLSDRLAAIKILVTRGPATGLGLPESDRPTVVIYARPYEPPPPVEYQQGWPVVTFPERRSSFLGRHKSLNYLFCLAARQYALEQGAREALLLESDGTVSEGAATGLVFAASDRFFTPQAASALPSITVAMLGRVLRERGIGLHSVPTSLSRLQKASGVWLANSLMGLMPVASLDRQTLARSDQTAFLNRCLWSEAR